MLSRFGDIWIDCTYIHTSDLSGSCSEEGPLFEGAAPCPLYVDPYGRGQRRPVHSLKRREMGTNNGRCNTRTVHLELAADAPQLEYGHRQREGRVTERSQVILEGLPRHPGSADVCVLTEKAADALKLPLVSPSDTERAWTVSSGTDVIAKVLYVPIDEGGWLAGQTSRAVSAVARARRRGGSVTADEKAGGSYVVAGYGSMPAPRVVVVQCRMERDRGGERGQERISLPYTRRSTWDVRTAAAIAKS